jgi:hypothetical protein
MLDKTEIQQIEQDRSANKHYGLRIYLIAQELYEENT